jgi:4-diphosphocytidyl-2-C-methyl-D-erythritol kinase
MSLEKPSFCKVNLLLNILGKRPDGFHELETVMHPVQIFDQLSFDRAPHGIELACTNPALPTDSRNLVHRAAEQFLRTAKINEGIRIHLVKNLPLAAGLGGGSGNAATTLLGLNELYDRPLTPDQLHAIAARLGSDIPFFLQSGPALASGRGEKIESLPPFPAFKNAWLLLVHPGFGISTPWAYQNLARFPDALNGRAGRARRLIDALQAGDLNLAAGEFYNSLEAPALVKHPLLTLYQDFFRNHGAAGTLMSGSGSTTFAIVAGQPAAATLAEQFKAKFGTDNWLAMVPA